MRIVAGLLLVSAAVIASAAEQGFYFGAAGGKASYDFEPPPPPAFVSNLSTLPAGWGSPPEGQTPIFLPLPPGAVVIISTPTPGYWVPGDDDEATTWSVSAGYRFSRYFAAELSYHHLGTLREYRPETTLGALMVLIPEISAEMESRGASLALIGQLPITDLWSVYFRAGGLFVEQDVKLRSGPIRFDRSVDSEVLLYGIGTQFDLGKHWSVRLDFQRFDDVGKGNGIGESDTDALTLNVLFRLGAN